MSKFCNINHILLSIKTDCLSMPKRSITLNNIKHRHPNGIRIVNAITVTVTVTVTTNYIDEWFWCNWKIEIIYKGREREWVGNATREIIRKKMKRKATQARTHTEAMSDNEW